MIFTHQHLAWVTQQDGSEYNVPLEDWLARLLDIENNDVPWWLECLYLARELQKRIRFAHLEQQVNAYFEWRYLLRSLMATGLHASISALTKIPELKSYASISKAVVSSMQSHGFAYLTTGVNRRKHLDSISKVTVEGVGWLEPWALDALDALAEQGVKIRLNWCLDPQNPDVYSWSSGGLNALEARVDSKISVDFEHPEPDLRLGRKRQSDSIYVGLQEAKRQCSTDAAHCYVIGQPSFQRYWQAFFYDYPPPWGHCAQTLARIETQSDVKEGLEKGKNLAEQLDFLLRRGDSKENLMVGFAAFGFKAAARVPAFPVSAWAVVGAVAIHKGLEAQGFRQRSGLGDDEKGLVFLEGPVDGSAPLWLRDSALSALRKEYGLSIPNRVQRNDYVAWSVLQAAERQCRHQKPNFLWIQTPSVRNAATEALRRAAQILCPSETQRVESWTTSSSGDSDSIRTQGLGLETRAKLEKRYARREYSVSKFDALGWCPFRHVALTHWGVRKKDYKPRHIEARHHGTAMHAGMYIVYDHIIAHDLWRSLKADDLEWVEALLVERKHLIFEEISIRDVLKPMLLSQVIRAVRRQLREDLKEYRAWIPTAVEMDFKGLAIEHPRVQGRRVLVRGSIDRIDDTVDQTQRRVLDYKRSLTKRVSHRHFQLPLYTQAAARMQDTSAEHVEYSAGWVELGTARLKPDVDLPKHMTFAMRRLQESLFALLDPILDDGKLDADPDQVTTCRRCDYRSLCREPKS